MRIHVYEGMHVVLVNASIYSPEVPPRAVRSLIHCLRWCCFRGVAALVLVGSVDELCTKQRLGKEGHLRVDVRLAEKAVNNVSSMDEPSSI